MSGFKTPTAMSPPRKQNSSRSNRDIAGRGLWPMESFEQTGLFHSYDATPSLILKFEEEAKTKELQRSSATPSPSKVPLPLRNVADDGALCGIKPRVARMSSATYPPPSSIDYNSGSEAKRPNTAPLETKSHDRWSSTTPTAVNSPLSAYESMARTVGRGTPCSKPLPPGPPCPDLEVYKRKESNGRLMVCEAREQHCSIAVKEFVGERTGLRGLAELKAELLRVLGHLGGQGSERARFDLRTVTGNMLERIVAWDLSHAETLEQPDVPILSTVPMAETFNKVDANYILQVFRSGSKKLPSDDIRSKVGRLPDENLMALLHFTLLVSRPVLVWELDLDEI